MTGDFNFPDLRWNKSDVPLDVSPSYIFLNTLNSLGLSQLVKTPTLGNNILDLVFTSFKSCTQSIHVQEPFFSSDHNSVYFELLDSSIEPTFRKRDFGKGNYYLINTNLESIDRIERNIFWMR